MISLVVVRGAKAAGDFAAAHMAIAAECGEVIGLAAGATMAPVYASAAVRAVQQRSLFASCHFFGLDELAGLPADDPNSFATFLKHNFFAAADVTVEQARFLRGDVDDLSAEAEAFEKEIAAAGGIGLQLLGIGQNGHIAFNEPGSEPNSRTRVVRLAPGTRKALTNGWSGGTPVPELGITMGIGSILEARRIVLVALGPKKAQALAAALEGPPDARCPASFLQTHPNVTVICDHAAAADLKMFSSSRSDA